ncbi:acyl-CoA carboxylase subunit epsilon [Streptomyces tagetis]|uniref:Acyl-CoA carboxylase subunit epsilon n=1 Tax=Streptomyces tagetis TaxID=2820809 RepID=A0A940XDC4_9ACTN|nr:acyl-CoA carboxylase subunit epsilon [Streptomyces sp. RG38]MBQ0825107.1 acyl-CoA carboxylase subunit epsilon [Streptomyces sp. RG38]
MIKVVRGNPTPEELAAVVALLSAATTPGPGPAPRPTTSWASPRRLLRTPPGHGPGGWLASALPQ